MNKFILTIVFCLCLSLVAAAEKAEPQKIEAKVGAYVIGLRDINTRARTFDADIWVWALVPEGTEGPIKSMEFINAKSTKREYPSMALKKGLKWEGEKIEGTFFQGLNLKNYPFDKHVLTINIEEALATTGELDYVIDSKNSAINPNIQLDEWKITGFEISPSQGKYHTNFGDPTLPTGSESTYNGMTLEISIKRCNSLNFVVLTTPVYVSVLIALLTIVFNPNNSKVLSSRYSLLTASLFLIIVSLRSTTDYIGSVDGLIPKIHIAGLLTVLCVVIDSFLTLNRLERGTCAVVISRRHRRFILSAGSIFILANFYLLYQAIY